MLFCYVSVLRKKSRLSRAGPAHLLGPAYPLDLLSRFRPLPRTDSQRCESGRDCYSLPKKDEFKIKKPAATYFPAFAVSSAQRCLTSVFGMGTGIATSPWPPAFITMPLLQGSGHPAGLLQALCTVFLWNTSLFPQGEAVIWPSLPDY